MSERELENVFLIFRNDDADETPAPTPAPTPFPAKRVINYRSCDRRQAGMSDVAFLDFTFNLETDTDVLPPPVEKEIIKSVTDAIITSVHDNHCGNNNRRQLSTTDRRLEIESISSGAQDSPLEACVPEDPASVSCTTFEGSLIVAFNDVGTESNHEDVGRSVFDTIKEDMSDGVYLEKVNQDLVSSTRVAAVVGSPPSVTRVKFLDTDYFDSLAGPGPPPIVFAGAEGASYAIPQDDGLNSIGRKTIGCMGILMALTVLFCCLWRRRKQQQRSAPLPIFTSRSRTIDDETASNTKRKSSNISNFFARILGDDEYTLTDTSLARTISTKSAKFNDLGRKSTKMDVHKCHKDHCDCCVRDGTTIVRGPSPEPRNLVSFVNENNNDDEPSQQGMETDEIFCSESIMQRTSTPTRINSLTSSSSSSKKAQKSILYSNKPHGHQQPPEILGRRVRFVKVGSAYGERRQVMDETGAIREEVEL